jgi:hypothetical protein
MRLVPRMYWPSIHGEIVLESSDDTGINYPFHSYLSLIARNTSYRTYEELERAADGPDDSDFGTWIIDVQGDGWNLHLLWSEYENPNPEVLRGYPNADYDGLLEMTGELGKLPFLEELAQIHD